MSGARVPNPYGTAKPVGRGSSPSGATPPNPYSRTAGSPPRPQRPAANPYRPPPSAGVTGAQSPTPGSPGGGVTQPLLQTQQPSSAPRPSPADLHSRLQAVLRRFEISIADAQDLTVLGDYDIVIVCDDSGSMQVSSLPPNQRQLPGSAQPDPTRWDELKNTVSCVVEIATIFDADGIDVYFLNRPPIKGVCSVNDPRLASAFQRPPSGTTPLGRCVSELVAQPYEKPVLLVIATDGVPDEGPAAFSQIIEGIVTQRSTSNRVRVQIMACTADDSAVGWLNQLDERFDTVDVTDDYYSEKAEVIRAGRTARFNRSDWVVKALLGPISQKFDAWDERRGGGQQDGGQGCCAGCIVM
eukprot:TRINITY_DN25209_c0_g1_i1.p1 TRINITY_DN25209_c0_g1~~TRINITY_DN25209_c0_g1_i1.p1  ORF type:complete len:355 (+),score=32.94 TRINITY_DN25209_c0_g1_i1:73-1137(+)